MDFATVSGLPLEDDPRVSFVGMRSRSKLVPYFTELYRRIEEEFEPAYVVLKSLGLGTVSDYSLFYRFRQKCCQWGVWVGAAEFSASAKVGFFDAEAVTHWKDLIEYSRSGMVPRFKGGTPEIEAEKTGLGAAISRAVNRGRLGALALEKWLTQGFGPTDIFRFLAPFFKGLTWWQVYLQVQKVRGKIAGGGKLSKAAVPGGKTIEQLPGRAGDILVFPSQAGATVVAPVAPGENASVNTVKVVQDEPNGLLELFGDLPAGGAVEDFFLSDGAAKLRSGAFWRAVGEAAGAEFGGNIEFGGLNVGVGPGGLGKLVSWTETFSLALARALGFRESSYAGVTLDSGRYKSFHPWFSVLGHLFRTALRTEFADRQVEFRSYFEKSRLRIWLPNEGGKAELGSIEEAFWLQLMHDSLQNTRPEFIVPGLAVEWKNGCSRIYLGGGKNSPWRSTNYNELFAYYAKTTFAAEPGDLENEVKRRMFKPGVF